MPESLWEKSCQVSDPGDGSPLPPHSFYLDRAWSSHTTAERKKIQTITISQDLLPAKEGEEARGTSEFWSSFQTEAAAEGQVQVPGYEVLRGMAQCQWAGSSCCSFPELGGS